MNIFVKRSKCTYFNHVGTKNMSENTTVLVSELISVSITYQLVFAKEKNPFGGVRGGGGGGARCH